MTLGDCYTARHHSSPCESVTMLHPNIQRTNNNTIHGTGLIAAAPIAKGEIIWRREASMQTFNLQEIISWSQTQQDEFFWFAFQCDRDTFIYTTDDDGYMNHSCDPNTWWLDDETLIARRDIAPYEEVTYDYASTEISIPYEMPCHCGTKNCRGRISHLDHLQVSWQALYGEYIPGFVKEAIKQHATE